MFRRFGFQSGKDVDKMAGMDYPRAENGIMYIPELTSAYISGKVVSETDMGTHTMFLADVVDARVLSEQEPVSYSYYQKHVKPAPKPVKKQAGYARYVDMFMKGRNYRKILSVQYVEHPASDFEKKTGEGIDG